MRQTRVVAKAILQNNDGNILLIRRSATDERRPLQWDVPGGAADDDEDFVAAVVRETEEETGLAFSHKDFHLAYANAEMTEKGNVCWLFFLGYSQATEVKLSAEHDMHKWVSPEESLKMITYNRQNKALKHIYENSLLS